MREATVLVVSSDMDFAKTVAEQVQSELSLACQIASGKEAAASYPANVSMVVTSECSGVPYDCPVVYATPPVRMCDLLDEIAAIRLKQSADDTILGKDYILQWRLKQLMHMPSGRHVLLTDKEINILQCLVLEGGKAVSKERLLKTVWGIDSALDTHTLETHIYRLRGKFRELAGDDGMVAASDGGYALAVK